MVLFRNATRRHDHRIPRDSSESSTESALRICIVTVSYPDVSYSWRATWLPPNTSSPTHFDAMVCNVALGCGQQCTAETPTTVFGVDKDVVDPSAVRVRAISATHTGPIMVPSALS